MVTTPLCTGIFSDRATLSGHDNPVFNNLANEQGSALAANVNPVNIITVSKNKKVITKELFSSPQILHHAPNSAQDSGNNSLCQGHQTVGPNTTMFKLFIRLLITSRSYKRPEHTKLPIM